jgi:hypothetical protein
MRAAVATESNIAGGGSEGVQASASGRSAKHEPTCTVTLEIADALGIGQTLRSLARDRRPGRVPEGLREALDRVGTALARAGMEALPGGRR